MLENTLQQERKKMNQKIKVLVLTMAILPCISFANLKPSDLTSVTDGSVVQVLANQVSTNCNFKEQVVNLGYDAKDQTIFACEYKKN